MKAIFFDLDDTLHDKSSTLRLMAEIQHDSFNLSRWAVTQSAWCEHYVRLHNVRMPKVDVFARLAGAFSLPEAMADDLLTAFDRECGKHARPFPGMMALLEACRDAGVVLGCVTNGRDHMQRSKLDGLGITSLFDAIVTSGGFGRKKPDPSIFDQCLSELGAQRTDSFFVGDSFDDDMQPAMALGMHAVWKSDRIVAGIPFASDSLQEICSYLLDRVQR